MSKTDKDIKRNHETSYFKKGHRHVRSDRRVTRDWKHHCGEDLHWLGRRGYKVECIH